MQQRAGGLSAQEQAVPPTWEEEGLAGVAG